MYSFVNFICALLALVMAAITLDAKRWGASRHILTALFIACSILALFVK